MHASTPGRSVRPHLERIPLDTADGPQVRLWHAPDRWTQVPASHLLPNDDLAAQRIITTSGVAPRTPVTSPRIVLVGAGTLAARLAKALLDGGDWHLAVSVPAEVAGAQGPATWQVQLAGGPQRARVTLLHHDPVDVWRAPDVVVVAPDTVEADRGLLVRLARRGAPHVVVTAHHDRAVVGPWVGAGSPACTGCLDRWWTEGDADYPAVLARLMRRSAITHEVVTAWAVATLVAHLARPDAGREALGGRTEVFDRCDPLARGTVIPPHPRCDAHRIRCQTAHDDRADVVGGRRGA